MDTFALLLDIVLALGAALILGLVLARLGQNAVVGYLLAGVIIGPHGLSLLRATGEVRAMAELGVALLLFTIGLELPWPRLRALGLGGLGTGLLQIVGTALVVGALATLPGMSATQGALVGMVVAFSSTAVVFRVLADRAEIDSPAARVSIGILLVQDVAVIPCVLLLPALAGAGAGTGALAELGGILGRGLLLIGALFVLGRTLMPVLIGSAAAARTRELFVILALTFCLGATWAAHAAHLSPVIGAFLAGVFLADTPYASQIRAEVAPLRAGFLALFFVSIGMLADPAWVFMNLPVVVGLVLAILVGKAVIAAVVVRLFGYSLSVALIAGATLAHIGELSFVVAEVGRQYALIDADAFRLVVSASVITLIAAPYLIGASSRLARLAARWRGAPEHVPDAVGDGHHERRDHVIVVGCGPTGLHVVRALNNIGTPHLVVELNPRTVSSAAARGTDVEYGDASQQEILLHAGTLKARALVVTVPDPANAAAIVSAARALRPDLPIIVRARYAQYAAELVESGADVLLNEEELMGEHLAAVTVRLLGLATEGLARLEPAGQEAERPSDAATS